MATLALVNETLNRVEDNTERTSTGITSFVDYLKDKDMDEKADKLEAKREDKKDKLKLAPTTGIRSSRGGEGFLSGLIPSFLKGLSIGAIASALPLIGRSLLKNVFKGAPLIAFADFIVDNLFPDGLKNSKFRDELAGGLKGLGFSLLLGGKFKLLFTAIGALSQNEEFMKSMDELTGNLKKLGQDLFKKMKPVLDELGTAFKDLFKAIFGDITMKDVSAGIIGILKPLAEAATAGVKGLSDLIKGDFSTENILKSVGLLGSIAVLLMPGKFMTLMARLALLTGGVAGGAIMKLATKGGGALLTGALSFFGMGSQATNVAGKLPKGSVPKAGGPSTMARMFGLLKSGAKGAFGLMTSAAGLSILVPLAAVGITEKLFGDEFRDEDQQNKAKQKSNVQTGRVSEAGKKFGLAVVGGSSALDLVGTRKDRNELTNISRGSYKIAGDQFSSIDDARSATGSSLRDFFVNKDDLKITVPIRSTGTSMNEKMKGMDFGIGPTGKAGMSPGAMGGSVAISADTNQTINNNMTTNALIASGPAVDLQDQMLPQE